MAWSIQLHLDAEPDALRMARSVVGAMARKHGVSEEVANSLELAVGEALLNAHEHVYRGYPGPLDIDVTADDQDLVVAVHNHGRPMITASGIPTTPPQVSSRHFGLFLIGQLMDRVHIVHPVNERGGTSIRMVKRWGTKPT
jgi:anti-sigma regulatory factor (Ser/Thr protein kinase)